MCTVVGCKFIHFILCIFLIDRGCQGSEDAFSFPLEGLTKTKTTWQSLVRAPVKMMVRIGRA